MWPKELNPYRENKQKQGKNKKKKKQILNWLAMLYVASIVHLYCIEGVMRTIWRWATGACAELRDISRRERITVCLWDWCRPRSMARSQAADGRPDCSHIRREVVSADERSRSLTFGLRKTRFSQLVWTKDLRKLMLKMVSQFILLAR